MCLTNSDISLSMCMSQMLNKVEIVLKALQSFFDLLPCSNVIGYWCTNECMVNKGTSSV